MPAKKQSPVKLTNSQVAAFRMAAHHLIGTSSGDAPLICSRVCGIQAQVTSAAELQLWARNHNITRAEIRRALNQDRTLVKTSLMRQTLHLIPSDEFPLYITALKSSRLAAVWRIMSKCRITPPERDALSDSIVDALGDGPLTKGELEKLIRPKASKSVKAWMAKIWSPLRWPIIEGRICYGPDRGRKTTYVRSDHWLPKQTAMDVQKAQHILIDRYFSSYGPATPRDFSKWSGITMRELKPVWDSMADELAEISVAGQTAWLQTSRVKHVTEAESSDSILRLLPSFDPYLLAHASKKHLVVDEHYKRIFRQAGWITPVVLLNGRVAGIWETRRSSSGISVVVELFEKFSKPLLAQLEEEAASLGKFLEAPVHLKISK
ncbi:MAG TPA: winged helix DNA-binding domain-containing protein [Candidatus Acidoferrales bacterium]|nr:winged helix DNA-binding domain-containing protein [Candidatus Acidoferrales bacterium]